MIDNTRRGSKRVTQVQDLPRGEHWAIIRESSVYIPGDERSRSNPGHGYPESSQNFITYESFATESQMREVLEAELGRVYSGTKPRGIHVTETFAGMTIVQAVKE